MSSPEIQSAVFGAGCFWGVEETFRRTPGVVKTEVGYTGGKTDNPTYREVCGHNTGHAEVVKVDFDPSRVSYSQLLEIFWDEHDPTQVNRQGPDVGDQYRSVIFTQNAEQAQEAAASLDSHRDKFRKPIATQIVPAEKFYPAEDYHQQYLAKRGRASCHI
jgi:peptide-methionine (S)-S-oxide reductase